MSQPFSRVTEADPAATVVLLHSSMSSRRQWRTLCAALAPSHPVLAFDLYGYGEAKMPTDTRDFSLDAEVARLAQLLPAAHATGPLHLVGHSYGGAVALRLALHLPGRVASVTVFEPTAFHVVPDRDAHWLDDVRGVAHRLAAATSPASRRQAVSDFIDFWSEPGAFAALPPSRQAAFESLADKVVLDFQALFDRRIDPCEYRALHAPVHLLGGRHSPPCARAVLAALARLLPQAEIALLPTGHMGPVTHEARVNDAILARLGVVAAAAS